MIKSFKCRETEKIFQRQRSKRFSSGIHRSALKRLLLLDAAVRLDDLKVPPANRLEALRGARKGQYSIRVNDQWRVCFKWQDGNALNVEIVDYH